MGFLSSVVGGVFGLGGSAMGASSARDAARESRKAQKELYQNRYQWSREDMQKAGLNPMLMQQHGPGSFPSVAQAQTFDPSAGIERGASAVAKSAQRALGKAQIKTEQYKQHQLAEQTSLAFNEALGRRYDNEIKYNTLRQMQGDDAWGAALRSSAAARDAGLISGGAATAAGIRNLLPAAKLGVQRTAPFTKEFFRTLPATMRRAHRKKYHKK